MHRFVGSRLRYAGGVRSLGARRYHESRQVTRTAAVLRRIAAREAGDHVADGGDIEGAAALPHDAAQGEIRISIPELADGHVGP